MRLFITCCLLLLFPAFAHGATVVSHKTGATARVADNFAGRFQGYINAIEAAGGRVDFMGGWRRGHCSSGHQHPCGRALDVCQTGRDRVASSCHLPPRHELAAIAAAHGLWEGGQWRGTPDYGHAQVGESGSYMSARRHHRHHHHHHRMARL